MTIKIFTLICAFLMLGSISYAQKADLITEKHHTPFGNLDKTPMFGHVVYGRQPDAKTITMMKDQGFNMVLSVRYDDEPVGFDSRRIVEKNGMSFVQISYFKGSIKDKVRNVDDDAVAQIKQILEATAASGGKVLLHCASGQRAAASLGSILYGYYDHSKEDARNYAEKAGLTSKNTGAIYDRYIDGVKN